MYTTDYVLSLSKERFEKYFELEMCVYYLYFNDNKNIKDTKFKEPFNEVISLYERYKIDPIKKPWISTKIDSLLTDINKKVLSNKLHKIMKKLYYFHKQYTNGNSSVRSETINNMEKLKQTIKEFKEILND